MYFISLISGWDSWSAWSACSVSCGTGRMDRHRYCLLDTKQVPTEQCSGDPAEVKSCTNQRCTGMWEY